jgi:hypothetical protein
LRIYFARDFGGYVDNLLAPEKRATSPSSNDIINGFNLGTDNQRLTLWPVNIRGNFCIVAVSMATAATPCLSTIHNLCKIMVIFQDM